MKLGIKKLVSRFWLLVFFLLLFLFVAVFQISLRQIFEAIISLKLWHLALLIFLYFLISLGNIVSRKYIIYALNHSSRFKNLVLIHFASMAAHYSTPAKIGFPLTVYLLKKREDIPYSIGTALVLIELSVNMGMCGVFALMGSLFYFKEYVGNIINVLLILAGAGLIFLFFLVYFVKKQKSSNRVIIIVQQILEAFFTITYGKALVYGLIIGSTQIFSSVSLVVLCYFYTVEISIWQALTASSVAFFLGAVTMIPMGLGVREASMILFLSRFGIDNVTSLSIVTIQRLLSTGLSFILGSLVGAFLGAQNTHLNQD
jgi:uncharacterized protein (TIRG00374 family)